MSNITQLVNVDKNLTMLKKGITASGLNKQLSENGPYTIFAPSDRAFDKLDKNVIDKLLLPEHKAELIDVLNHHVVAGKINFDDLKDGGTLKSVNGRELKVHVKEGHVSIDGAQIQGKETSASNGFLYSLDTVMLKN
jgi:uncharacterized surface protein with fasciclin (FAS1) repeats